MLKAVVNALFNAYMTIIILHPSPLSVKPLSASHTFFSRFSLLWIWLGRLDEIFPMIVQPGTVVNVLPLRERQVRIIPSPWNPGLVKLQTRSLNWFLIFMATTQLQRTVLFEFKFPYCDTSARLSWCHSSVLLWSGWILLHWAQWVKYWLTESVEQHGQLTVTHHQLNPTPTFPPPLTKERWCNDRN